jgi:hypothetical protein
MLWVSISESKKPDERRLSEERWGEVISCRDWWFVYFLSRLLPLATTELGRVVESSNQITPCLVCASG